MTLVQAPGRFLVLASTLVFGCNSGQDCGKHCDSEGDNPSVDLRVDCESVAVWVDGELTEIVSTSSNLVIGGNRVLSEGESADAWLARSDPSGSIAWELSLPEGGQIRDISAASDGYYVLQRELPTGTRLHTVSQTGELASTVVLTADEASVLAETILADEQRVLVGGSVAGDMWLASLDTNGDATTVVLEDHLGFTDRIDHFMAMPSGYLAVANVGTTPGSINGDISVAEAVDTLLVLFDDQLGEQGRITLSDEDQYVSTIATSATLASDGSVVLVGYRLPTLDAGERKAWAARIVDAEQAWFVEWRGPADSQSAHPLASLHAVVGVGSGMVVGGGRKHTRDGISRWHLLLDIETGEAIVDELGDPSADFDSYLASARGEAYFSGTTKTTQSEQWVCTFEVSN